jgi:hypothetical protein
MGRHAGKGGVGSLAGQQRVRCGLVKGCLLWGSLTEDGQQ